MKMGNRGIHQDSRSMSGFGAPIMEQNALASRNLIGYCGKMEKGGYCGKMEKKSARPQVEKSMLAHAKIWS
ncbi:hypothetical protein RHGRI_018728 [Rhododendron griersonianum]|uniref:Uncharacterized protein n=1 Tax=Rhododendron griersonianum TaxID=479676 RepID=A0AAV6K2M3_9ERIC|nr:hypothetical protein RHGRI_018728 [Rhododendron griersonianum]